MSIGFHWYMRLWAPKKWDNCGLWSDIGISLESVHYIIMFFNHSKLVINQGWFGDDPPENSCANLTMLHHFAIKRSKNNSNLKNTKTESMGFSNTHTLCMYIYVYVIIIIYICVCEHIWANARIIHFFGPKKNLTAERSSSASACRFAVMSSLTAVTSDAPWKMSMENPPFFEWRKSMEKSWKIPMIWTSWFSLGIC